MTSSRRTFDPEPPGGSAAGALESLVELLGEAGARRGFRKLAAAARQAAELEAEVRGLIRRFGNLDASIFHAAAVDGEAIHTVLEVLERAADAAATAASTTEATLREMELPWGAGEDEPADSTVAQGARTSAAGSPGSPLIHLLATARRAVRLEADFADALWRLRLLALLPDSEMAEAAGWALERLEPAGEAARAAAFLIEQVAQGAENDPADPSAP
jgi:hypothetical protein